jgi:hypothetical protein
MSWFNRKDAAKTNEFGVVPVLFHTACNLVGEHGTVRVSNPKLQIKNAVVSFFLQNYAEAPAFTPRLFMELESAAESQGYVLHELISYVRIVSPEARQDQGYSERGSEDLAARMRGRKEIMEQHVAEDIMRGYNWPGTGTIHHAESSAKVGEALLRNASRVPPQAHRESFDVHSLNGDFAKLNVPAYMRKQPDAPQHPALQRMDAAIKALIVADGRAWPLDPDKFTTFLPYLTAEKREELQTSALLLAAKLVNDPAKHEQLLQELVTLADAYVEMSDMSPTAK